MCAIPVVLRLRYRIWGPLPEDAIERECIVCYSSYSSDHFPIISKQCQHAATICNGCTSEYLNTQIAYNGELSCPHLECSSEIDISTLRSLLEVSVFNRYCETRSVPIIEQLPNFFYCPTRGCGNVMIIDDSNRTSILICTKCKVNSCIRHKVSHPGQTCDQYERNKQYNHEEEQSALFIKSCTKACPRCKVHIEKNGGCAHMMCAKCKYEFF